MRSLSAICPWRRSFARSVAAAAQNFFGNRLARDGWATCPLVEKGFLRIFGSRIDPGGPGTPQAAREILSGLLASPGHQFLPDNLGLCDITRFPSLPGPQTLTALYLLGLAVKHGGRFATFDASLDASLIPGGPAAYYLLPAG